MTNHPELIQEIQKHLGVSESLAQQFAQQQIILQRLEQHFSPNGLFITDKEPEIERQLNLAAKSINYTNPYHIAVVGNTGAGKSELINALLGRSLVPSEAVSSVTGTAVEVFFDQEAEEEKLGIVLRTENDILKLVEYFIEEFGLSETVPNRLTETMSDELRNWQPATPLTDDMENQRFQNLRTSLANLITCHIRYGDEDKIREFLLPKDIRGNFTLVENILTAPRSRLVERHLNELINEDSGLNKNKPLRRIDLIDSLTYRVKAAESPDNQSFFHLPSNVCLVDLPGLNPNMPLHNLIFTKGVKNANVVLLVLPPNRIPEIGSPLYNLVKRSISSASGIFLVVNRWDEFPKESAKNMNKLQTHMEDIKTHFGVNKYYKTSAYVALNAQLALRKETIDAPDFYEKAAQALSASPFSHEQALTVSSVPELLQDMMDFVHNTLIKNEFEKGKRALNAICQILQYKYTPVAQQPANHVDEFLKLVAKCQLEVENVLGQFHREQVNDTNMEALRDTLEVEAKNICEYVDRYLLQRDMIAKFWEQCYTAIPHKTILDHDFSREVNISWNSFLDKTQLAIWKILPRQMERLAQLLTDTYRKALQHENVETQVAERIAHLAPSLTGSTAIEGLENEIQEMSRKLTELSHHVVLLQVYNPEVLLNVDKSSGLKNALDQIPKQKELQPDRFEALVEVVRAHYENAVINWSVEMLLEFYKYQMAYIEQMLGETCIRDFFAQLNKRVSDSAFCNEVLTMANANNASPKDLDLLAQKRAALNEVCHTGE